MSSIIDLQETMARLRAPDGCPWDKEQTHQSICQCLVDECSELLETIDHMDMDHMKEELGDVLLQVVFHAQMAKEDGHFDFDAVAQGINDKLVRRHPHVFGDLDLGTSDEVLVEWEKIKAQEKGNLKRKNDLFKKLPPAIPALLYAVEIFKQIKKKAMTAGPSLDDGTIEGIAEDLNEETAGKLLFDIAAACRVKGIDPESAVRRYALKVKDEAENLNAL